MSRLPITSPNSGFINSRPVQIIHSSPTSAPITIASLRAVVPIATTAPSPASPSTIPFGYRGAPATTSGTALVPHVLNQARLATSTTTLTPSSVRKTRGMDCPMRVAVIGAGSISREFATSHFGPSTNSVVACVVDVDEKRARALAADVGSVQAGSKLRGGSHYLSRPEQSLGHPIPHFTELTSEALAICDCIYIGTPPSAHAAFVFRSLNSGKHVILEKPIAASAEDADAIVDIAERASKEQHLYTSLNIGMRWNTALERMKSELEHGRVGTLKDARLRLHFCTWPREWQVQPWCAGRAEGGPLREVGTHFLFGIHELFGHGCVNRACEQLTYEDGPNGSQAEASVEGTLALHPGVFGCEEVIPIYVSVLTNGTGLEQRGRDLYEFEIRGDKDSLCLFDFTSLRDSQGRILVRNAPYGRHECITELMRAVAGQPSKLITAIQARNAQRVLDAMLASHGNWVQVFYE